MEIQIFPADIGCYSNGKVINKVSREIIEVLKNNNLSTAEAKYIFEETLRKLVCDPIS